MAAYAGWLVCTLAFPWTALLGGFIAAWHSSLQHETIHGHPTRWRAVNAAIGFLPVSLWLPYGIYRETHLAHHRCPRITDPVSDPESFYETEAGWQRMGRVRQAFLRAHMTLVGRLILGPPYVVARLWLSELARFLRGDFRNARIWLGHAAGVAAVLVWVIGVCGIPLWLYLLAFVYPGVSLTLLRSFAEHRAHPALGHQTGIVTTGRLMSLLYLNNNLHTLHHDNPRLPWFAYRRADVAGDTYQYSGYIELLRRYAFWPKEEPVHPAYGRRSPH